jgi:hypothetical protein
MSKLLELPEGIERRRQYDKFWDFTDQPVTSSLLLEPVSAGPNANDDVAATLVGIIPRASRIIGGYIGVSANSAGIDANNTSAWVVAVGGSTAISKTCTADLVENVPVALDAPALPDVAAGAAVTLAITNGTAADLNSATCYAALQLADKAAFPAPGLKVIATNAGTVTISDGVKGVCAISPGAVDNDEIYLCTSTEVFKFADQKPAVAECLIQWTESTTDDANIIFGFKDAVAADSVLDDGGGPAASYSGAVFFKVDGGTTWNVETSVGSTQSTKALSADYALDKVAHSSSSTSYQLLRIEIHPYSSTQVRVEFYLGTLVNAGDWSMTHVATNYVTFSGCTEMQVFVGVKNGSAHAETLNIDYLGCGQLR